MITVIGIKGPSQSGKSTLAAALAEYYTHRGYNVRRTSFGDAVREEVAKYCEWKLAVTAHPDTLEQINNYMSELRCEFYRCYGTDSKTTMIQHLEHRPAAPISRAIQQWWGQDFRRAQDELYWIKKSFARNADFIFGPPHNILIEESVRQPNEGAYIHALGGCVIDCVPLEAPTAEEQAARQHSVEKVAASWEGDFKVDMGQYFSLTPAKKLGWIKAVAEKIDNNLL